MVTQSIKPGYKQTELGIIPEDWKIKKLGEVANIYGGGTPSTRDPEYWNGSVNWFTPTEVGFKKYISSSLRKITKKGFEKSSAKLLPKESILLTTRAGIGDLGILLEEGCTNQGFQSFVVNREISTEFLYYLLITIKKILIMNASGSTFLEISSSKIKNIDIIVPDYAEQSAIASVLSDTDALIKSLDKLVEKKKAIKQGAMQQLLTGKKRLPGYKGEWKTQKLGQISEIKTGKKNNDDKLKDGAYPFFVRSQTVERINSYSYDGEAILVPGEGNIGSIFHYIFGKFDYHQRVYKISDFHSDVNGKLIYFYMLQYFNLHAMKNSVKATVDSLRLPTFQEFEVLLPPSKEEQNSIVKILSEMDLEIGELEQKLDKYKLIKQGMMQELLTGRIRLPC